MLAPNPPLIVCIYLVRFIHCGMYMPLSDDKHQMVRDSSKKRTGQHGRISNPVATLPHAAVVFRMQPFNNIFVSHIASKFFIVLTYNFFRGSLSFIPVVVQLLWLIINRVL